MVRQFLKVDLWSCKWFYPFPFVSFMFPKPYICKAAVHGQGGKLWVAEWNISATLASWISLTSEPWLAFRLEGGLRVCGCPSTRRLRSLSVLCPWPSPRDVLSCGDSELKDSGTLFSVPIISKNASRWSREIISFANYPTGWADRILHSPTRHKGSWLPGQCWPHWLAATQHRACRSPSSSVHLLTWGSCWRPLSLFILEGEGGGFCSFNNSFFSRQIPPSVRNNI